MRAARLVRSSSAARRLLAAQEWLASQLEASAPPPRPGSGTLLLAPTRGAADDLLRRAVAAGGACGVYRTTLPQVAAELAIPELAAAARAPVSALGIDALAAHAVSICLERNQLRYFRPVAELPGFARAVGATLSELRKGGVEAKALAAVGRAGRDLEALLSVFDDALSRWGLVDEADLLRLAARRVERAQGRAAGIVGLPLLLVDLSPASPVEERLLAALSAAAPAVLATAVDGDDKGCAALQRSLGCEPEDLDLERSAGVSIGSTTRLERLRRTVFRADHPGGNVGDDDGTRAVGPPASTAPADHDDAPPRLPGMELDDSLDVLSAPGEGRECAEIARRVLEHAAAGTPFDRMAILLRDPHAYMPLLEEACRRAGLPVHLTRGAVRPHPSGHAFLALLSCASEGLSASRFAEYLSLGQTPVPDAEGRPRLVEVPWVEAEGAQLVFKTLVEPPTEAELVAVASTATTQPADISGPTDLADPFDPADGTADTSPVLAGTLRVPRHWERLLVDAAVVGGRERWRRRLRGLRAELRLQLESRDEPDDNRAAHIRRRLARLHNLESFALPVIDALATLPGSAAAALEGAPGQGASWGTWLEALRRLAMLTLRHPELVLGVLAELQPMDSVGPVLLDEVQRTLHERLSTLRVEPGSRRHGRLWVASIDEARGCAFDIVFLPGLAEGLFPRRIGEDPLLLDNARDLLQAALITKEERYQHERLLLRIAAGAARRRLVVSYPTLDMAQGRARVPSFYALDVLRAAEGRLPDIEELQARAAASTSSLLGWPAPQDPARAIDEAEFDIAYLEPLLARSPNDIAGRARFLLGTNPHLDRALRARWHRWKQPFTPADGLVEPGAAALTALSGHRLTERSYSPTALQRYAACPYQFLLHAVHRLRPRPEVVALEKLDPLTRGSLFHEIQHELLIELRDRSLLPVTADNRAEVFDVADAVLQRVAAVYQERLAPAIPRVWRNEIQAIGTDLRGWLQRVARDDGDWMPAHFELAFGLGTQPGRDEASQPDEVVVLGGVRLRGAIDLVERRRVPGTSKAVGGDETAAPTWRVTDHKTGKAPRERFLVLRGGEVMQPLLYALAAESLLEGPVASGRLFYCTRRGEYETREVELNADTRARVEQALGMIDDDLAAGFLPAAPRDGACRYCDYRIVCGPYEEIRLRRKDQGRLARLRLLRGTP